MAKLRKRKRKKMTITQRYNRIAVGLQYFGISLNEKKRATTKALTEAQRIYREARKEAKAGGITELPSIAQLEKYVRESQHEVDIPSIDDREELPYAGVDETPYYNETEDIINGFMSTMEQALSEATRAYGLAQPWRAKAFEQQILGIMSKFNEIRGRAGDEYIAQKIADSLDYQAIVNTIAYDYDEATEMLDNMSDVFDGILDSWM